MFYAPSRRRWIGRFDIPTGRMEPRAQQIVSAKLFCQMLRKYSQLEIPEPPERRPRKENLRLARKIGKHTEAEWFEKIRAQRGLCHYCGKRGYGRTPVVAFGRRIVLPQLVQDHMVPLVRGGSDSIDNIVGACDSCNSRKGTLTADEFMAVLRGG